MKVDERLAPVLVSRDPPRVRLGSRRATTRFARALSEEVGVGDLVILTGDLGTGKTFLTRALCRALGVPHEIPVTSPSFALVNELEARVPILHCDLYRLSSVGEVDDLGLRDRRDQHLMLVEWGAEFQVALGDDALEIALELDGDVRTATFAASGPRALACSARLVARLAS